MEVDQAIFATISNIMKWGSFANSDSDAIKLAIINAQNRLSLRSVREERASLRLSTAPAWRTSAPFSFAATP